MRDCAGRSRSLADNRTQPCPYAATEGEYCYFHAKVVAGHITSTDVIRFRREGRAASDLRELSWRPKRSVPVASEQIDVLMREWDMA